MQNVNRKIFTTLRLLVALAVLPLASRGEDLRLDIQVPRVVSTGEIFRLTFIANAKVEKFTPPTIEGFSVTAGPAQSSSSNVSIVNGKVSQSTTMSFTYTLHAEKEGKFTIGAASVTADGKEAQSQPHAIEVVKGEPAAARQQQGNSSNQQQQSTSVNDNSLYLGVAPSKTEVYRGECLVATTKLYNRGLALSGIENIKEPTYNGFWTQAVEKATQLNYVRENVNGTVYDACTLWKHLLIPQQTGELTIAPSEMDVSIQVRVRSNNPFDDFFGGGYQTIRKHLQSKTVKVRVKDLPAGAPASFAGAVGTFKIDASLSRNQLTANDATTLTIRISGSGNLMLLNAPKVDYPVDFEAYDAKTIDNIKNTTAGANGHRQFEIPLIPRSAGDFVVPPIAFSYFNPATQQYATLHTKELPVTVEKDTKAPQGGYSAGGEGRREGIKVKGQDIRFIKSNVALAPQAALFFGSAYFYLAYLLLVALALAAYLWLKKRRKEEQNLTLVRNRKANKVAKKRLRNSAQLLKMGNAQGFYDELLRAMWGYLGDKLAMPVADLSRESASTAFSERGIEESYTATFLSVIDECEFARYAPGSTHKGMAQLYADAAEVISKLEQRIK
jgi:hypothetical protein